MIRIYLCVRHWIVEQLEEGEECPPPARREPSGPGRENPIIHEEKKPGKTENSSFASSDEAQTVLNYIAPTLGIHLTLSHHYQGSIDLNIVNTN